MQTWELFSKSVTRGKSGRASIPDCALHINVALVLDGEVRVVWYDVTIVNLYPTHNIFPSIVGSVVGRVTILVHRVEPSV